MADLTPMHQFVIDQLLSSTQTYLEIAEATGLSDRTIAKIARQEIVDPGVSHVETLAQYFGFDTATHGA